MTTVEIEPTSAPATKADLAMVLAENKADIAMVLAEIRALRAWAEGQFNAMNERIERARHETLSAVGWRLNAFMVGVVLAVIGSEAVF